LDLTWKQSFLINDINYDRHIWKTIFLNIGIKI